MTNNENQQPQPQPVTALQDLIAGGVAGSASVIVGHPFDTYKVRLQTSTTSSPSNAAAFGGVSSLFRGMGAPLSTAAVVNALIFSSYGESSRIWDEWFMGSGSSSSCNDSVNNNNSGNVQEQSSWKKPFVCGSFAGGMQALVICPSEHIKCRLQIQHGVGCKDHIFKGPFDAADKIINSHGIKGLYRGFICTAWREVPAFGLYFATYDCVKNSVTKLILGKDDNNDGNNQTNNSISAIEQNSAHQWMASALAGGFSGAFTWAAIYPFDVIKTRIQTTPIDTPIEKRRIHYIYKSIVNEHGIKFLFRGLGVTLLRAFPVNAIIFPVYEFTLVKLTEKGIGNFNKNSTYIESTA